MAQQAFTSFAWYSILISLSMLGTNNDTILLLNSSEEAINQITLVITINTSKFASVPLMNRFYFGFYTLNVQGSGIPVLLKICLMKPEKGQLP